MEIKKVAVLGAGTMGRGIAQWFAQAGVKVQLADQMEEVAFSAETKVHESWEKLQAKNKFTSDDVEKFKKNFSVADPEKFDQDTDLLIEAIIEKMEIKQAVFSKYDSYFSEKTIIASNTSSLSIDEMAKELTHKERFLGLHFFNPATIMKLVEIVRGSKTDNSLVNDLYQWFDQKGKKPAICNNAPGFIVNRVARNFYGESLRLVGHENTEKMLEVDTIMKEVGGFKMGPFELMDLIGIDVNYEVTKSVWKSFYFEDRFAPHALQRKMVESGRLGKKTKEGFYNYKKD